MPHLLVYLQRSPLGLHPASATALCLARDVATTRGATVTCVCPGDTGDGNSAVLAAAGRFGADIVLFAAPDGLRRLAYHLQPRRVLVPWTQEGRAASDGLTLGPVRPRWLVDPDPEWASEDPVLGVAAGGLPWHTHNTKIEPEFEQDVAQVELPEWARNVSAGFVARAEGDICYLGDPDRSSAAALAPRNIRAADPDALPETGTLLWFGESEQTANLLAARPHGLRVVLLPGEGADTPSDAWAVADWVLPGSASDAIAQLDSGLWKEAMA